MGWDIQQDFQTGDWQWNSLRDLASIDGRRLLQQRVHVRLMVSRGEFIYDRTGRLGSRLRSLLVQSVPVGASSIEAVVREALEPMNDIVIKGVRVFTFNDGSGRVTNPTEVRAQIEYTQTIFVGTGVQEIPGRVTTEVTIPV